MPLQNSHRFWPGKRSDVNPSGLVLFCIRDAIGKKYRTRGFPLSSSPSFQDPHYLKQNRLDDSTCPRPHISHGLSRNNLFRISLHIPNPIFSYDVTQFVRPHFLRWAINIYIYIYINACLKAIYIFVRQLPWSKTILRKQSLVYPLDVSHQTGSNLLMSQLYRLQQFTIIIIIFIIIPIPLLPFKRGRFYRDKLIVLTQFESSNS